MSFPCRILCSLSLVLACAVSAGADTIQLANGDRLTGIVTSITDETVVLETEYAGAITIQRDAVSAVCGDAIRPLLLPDATSVEGRLVVDEEQWLVQINDTLTPLPSGIALDAVEPEESPQEPPRRWSGAVDAGLALRSGNTDTTDAKFGITLKRTGERNTLTLALSSAYASADGTLNTRRYLADFRWQLYLRERLYSYALGQFERDDGRKLDHRVQGGVGMGYDIIKRERTTLAADMGLTHTWERWNPYTPWERTKVRNATRNDAFNRMYSSISTLLDESGGDPRERLERLRDILADIIHPLRNAAPRKENYLNLRLGVIYTQQLFKTATLKEELVVMPQFERIGEFRAVSDLSLNVPISDALSLRTSLKTEYDSLASEKDVKAWDNTLMTQLRYAF